MESRRQDVDKGVPHLPTHECGGVPYSPAIYDTGIFAFASQSVCVVPFV